MKTYTRLLIVALALLPVVGALATPSTLIWIPSTDIQCNKSWHLGIDNYFAPNNTRQATVYDIGPEYGFAGGRAEAGLDYVAPFANPLFFNAKYLLTPEKGSTPALVVGGEDFGTQKGISDYNMVYLEGSKTLGALPQPFCASKRTGPVRLTLGYCHGKKSTLGRDPDMLLAGLDTTLDTAKKWWGAVDYQSGRNAFGALSTGVSYNFAANTSVIFGYDWLSAPGAKNTVTTQLDINF